MLGRKIHRIVLVLIDALLVAVAFGVAYQLRFDFHVLPEYKPQFLHLVGFVVVLRLVVFGLFHLYRGILRYASIHELRAIIFSVSIGTIILILCNLLIEHVPRLGPLPLHDTGMHVLRIPWGVLVMEWGLSLILIGGGRLSRRMLLTARQRVPSDARRVLVLGAGDEGEAVVRDMLHNPQRGSRPVVFSDDDQRKIGRRIHNLQVVGDTSRLRDAIERYQIDTVVIALPDISPKKIREIVAECKKTPVSFKIVPSMHALIEGRVSVSEIRPVEIEDLLGREPVRLELPPDKNYLRGERIMVTGAGGSIGSELCRQIVLYHPRKLLLFGKGENSIHEIATELGYHFEDDRIAVEIGDIRDGDKLEHVFSSFRPAIVFHAAAHKHVPLMEINPDEAVRNNITGTYKLARMADKYQVAKFIFTSTDKAVRPTSIMGATKRVGEMVIYGMDQHSSTHFMAVRFGNVLGSRGSVIPLFKQQIQRGGPVTVTHSEAFRYFMTIPEAVSLVIHSGAIGKKGQLFLLDMGTPVRIADLAANLITLSGYEPGVDIDIVYTGLRPGDKLSEELLTKGEGVHSTEMGKIFVVEAEKVDWDSLQRQIALLEELAAKNDRTKIVEVLKQLVPDFAPTH
jgi:FlaA1/EpsC-like NDP-sugar epimerase